ncbi:metal-dependent hydrolase [Paenibacillus sp. 1P07SE]|uniref:metal-dependent hydrolase n=1 Tax=Paenibacillus sp. 1P07SE TaxID=3132209 RepID=UPI0039A4A3BD
MKGSTHLAIGTAVGLAGIVYQGAYEPGQAAWLLSVAAFSSLSPDLDAPSMLTRKLTAASRFIRGLVVWAGTASLIVALAAYASNRLVYPELVTAAVALILLGLIARQGVIRNALVSGIGACLLYTGVDGGVNWLAGLGLFVVIAPWLKHRGLTHTVWAMAGWGYIAWELERELQLPGIMWVAIAAYASHLLADTLTPQGVRWLYPLWRKAWKL